MNLTVRPLTGAELAGALGTLADLRIAVFADWPYLYERGDGGADGAPEGAISRSVRWARI